MVVIWFVDQARALELDLKCAKGSTLRTNTSLSLRYRRDGSVYFHKQHPIWSALGEIMVTLLFIIIGLFLLGLAIVRP